MQTDGASIRINSQAVGRKFTVRRKTKPTVQLKAQRAFLRSKKRVVRYGLLSANLVLLAVVVFFVAQSPSDSQAVRQNAVTPATAEVVTGPLDQLSSADIAVHVANAAGLPESIEVTNNADSIALAEASSPADTSVVAKPQLVASALVSYKDIQQYTTVAGDTISSIASRFGISSDSVRWSNGLSGETVRASRTLFLPPAGTNGIVHTVLAGDTPDSLAARFSADKDLIVSVNDAEVSGLRVGQKALIPGGVLVATSRGSSYSASGFAWGTSAIYGRNGYVRGYCTYYAASRVAVPANWGNARTWASGARASGWTVSSTPRPGAIAQTVRMHPLGHVGIVEEVSPDGTMIKYSDMNGLAGFGRVGYSDWVSAGTYENYIYR